MAHQTFFKDPRGTALLHSRARRAERTAHEQREMQAALKRDGRVCRWPACEYRTKDLPIDPCHVFQHRGMGGDPSGDRTRQDLIMAACRMHHGLIDNGTCEVHALTDKGTDGPVMFFKKHPETGRMEHVATETRIGVSVAVGA